MERGGPRSHVTDVLRRGGETPSHSHAGRGRPRAIEVRARTVRPRDSESRRGPSAAGEEPGPAGALGRPRGSGAWGRDVSAAAAAAAGGSREQRRGPTRGAEDGREGGRPGLGAEGTPRPSQAGGGGGARGATPPGNQRPRRPAAHTPFDERGETAFAPISFRGGRSLVPDAGHTCRSARCTTATNTRASGLQTPRRPVNQRLRGAAANPGKRVRRPLTESVHRNFPWLRRPDPPNTPEAN